jgi:hypothetical protein
VKPHARHARRRSSHVERLRRRFVPSDPRHAPSRPLSARCSATQARTSTALPNEGIPPSFIVSRPAALLGFTALRRFAPADGWIDISAGPGPPVVLHVARPPRLIFVGVTDRLRWVVTSKRRRPGDFVFGASVRLPGFDSHLRSASASSFLGQRTDPALGFASCRVFGRVTAHAIGLDPDHITGLRDPAAR